MTAKSMVSTTLCLALSGAHSDAAHAKDFTSPTCKDIMAYIEPDNTMSLRAHTKLLIAGGFDSVIASREEEDFRQLCEYTAKNHLRMIQAPIKLRIAKPDGGQILITYSIGEVSGVCKFTNVQLSGC